MFEDYNDILRVQDIQSALRIGRTRAYELVKEGKLARLRVGNKILVPKKSLIEYVEQNCYNQKAADAESHLEVTK